LARRAEKVDGEVILNKFLAGGERGEKGLGPNAYSRVHCGPIPNYNVRDIKLWGRRSGGLPARTLSMN
jgi:hypothetical protein